MSDQPGYIYLMRLEQDRDPSKCPYKIGKSKTPRIRRAQLGIQLPYPLVLVHVWETDDMHTAEWVMHGTYECFRLNGEWFRLPPEVVAQMVLERDIITSLNRKSV